MLMFDSNCVHIHMNKYIPLIITSYLYIKACAYVNTFLKFYLPTGNFFGFIYCV